MRKILIAAAFALAACGGGADRSSYTSSDNAVKNAGDTIVYSGQGAKADELCGTANGAPVDGPYLLWVLTAGGASSATLSGSFGADVPMTEAANGAFKYVSAYYDPATLVGVVSATFEGPANNPQLVIGELFGHIGDSNTYNISGTVFGPTGVVVALSGAASATTTTNESGYYIFSGLSNGTYTLSPLAPGYGFYPQSLSLTVSNSDVTSQNFNAFPTYSISGTVTTENGATIPDVTITLYERYGGMPRTTTTDASGNFIFTGLSNGDYALAPQKAGYTFIWGPQGFIQVRGSDVIYQNFIATLIGYDISVLVGGLYADGLVLQYNGTDHQITSNGAFSIAKVPDGTPYSVTIKTQPIGQTCDVANNSGVVSGANVSNIAVMCSVATIDTVLTASELVATIAGWLNALTGEVSDLKYSWSGTVVPGLAGGYVATPMGYSFCIPSDPFASPVIPPPSGYTVFGCENNFSAAVAFNSSTQATLTFSSPVFALVNVNWWYTWPGWYSDSGSFRAYGEIAGDQVVVVFNLVDMGNGVMKVVGVDSVTLMVDPTTVQLHTSDDVTNSLLNYLLLDVEDYTAQSPWLVDKIEKTVLDQIEPFISLIPPFTAG